MVGTNCSYTPILMLVLPEHLQPLSKGLCLFLGQPQSCVLVRPRSSQLAQSGGWGDRRRRWWHRRDKACDKRCQCRTCCSICPSQVPFTHHSPLPLPGSLEGNSLQFAWTAGIIIFFCILCSPFSTASPPGWNASFLSFSLSCSEISAPIPPQSSVTACFVFLLSALCFDPLIRGLGFYLEDICLRCLV